MEQELLCSDGDRENGGGRGGEGEVVKEEVGGAELIQEVSCPGQESEEEESEEVAIVRKVHIVQYAE